MKQTLLCLIALAATAVAKDPAQGWLGYATGLDPAAKNGDAGRRITFAEMYCP